ncbi:hypothetical protein ABH930_006375 [Kitasatospora sp. GAS204A]|uniref:hypothetical protein n=1 Tax=unclassified Kitasatospora TaxID=2633591 RepID=UPI0024754BEE|nr:hypothetical protein [Kitasatospora sp. GAS204B]MDH6122033.1 hypothetical protein [Kitasatospora sp. GAS204B]
MNGPDHYQEAERLIDSTQDQAGNYENSPNLAAALAHAVLALAAATALNDTDPNGHGMPLDDCDLWQHVAGVETNQQRESRRS